jgi:hypothetical protein
VSEFPAVADRVAGLLIVANPVLTFRKIDPTAITPAAFSPRITKVTAPGLVGVPEITPVPSVKLSPVGKSPLDSVYFMGTKPVVGVGAAVLPATSALKVFSTKVKIGAATVRVNCDDPVPRALLAKIVTVNGPVAVGVPLITPVAVLTAKPVGKPMAS